MRRILAHNIVYRGIDHRLSVAQIADDGTVSVQPFTEETASTEFVNGTFDLDQFIRASHLPDPQDVSQSHIS